MSSELSVSQCQKKGAPAGNSNAADNCQNSLQGDGERDQVDQLIALFNGLFANRENTRLICGGNEPVYLPANEDCSYHRILFAHGFFNSALHEIAHWCVAGPERRLLEDFGYWYEPDGRTAAQQRVFEQVEVKPQALEWIFAKSCGRRFRVSADNLALAADGVNYDDGLFKQRVYEEVLRRLREGLPERAARFSQALIKHYRPGFVLHKSLFDPAEIF